MNPKDLKSVEEQEVREKYRQWIESLEDKAEVMERPFRDVVLDYFIAELSLAYQKGKGDGIEEAKKEIYNHQG